MNNDNFMMTGISKIDFGVCKLEKEECLRQGRDVNSILALKIIETLN